MVPSQVKSVLTKLKISDFAGHLLVILSEDNFTERQMKLLLLKSPEPKKLDYMLLFASEKP